MDQLFELLRILVWPAALIWLGYLFRNEVREMSKRFAWGKERDVRARVEEMLKRADEKAAQVTKEMSGGRVEPTVGSPIRHEVLMRLAQTSARAAIIETWVEVDATITDMARDYYDISRGPMASRRAVERLVEDDRLPRVALDFYQAMRDLRNSATHFPDKVLIQSDAERYLDHALHLARLVRTATA